MRRFVAILLLLTFCSFLSAPLLAASSDPYSNLPACCRKDGKHHCMMRMMMKRDQTGTQVSNMPEKCPLFPKTMLAITVQGHLFVLPTSGTFYAALRSHPACYAQTEAHYRISFDRSRQKRGPPVA